ncbi:YdhR family protein [Paraburkholderia sp. BL21I4N1]|uniref:YdhR family protein n=1 Tax=Paraburkholderia sp. BL21I4N1 TaxID=1938801 RepID=UPI000CFA85A1|nr:YdhR family protein [Paraburkholderia sp. BL21I4N1]PQV55051.1 putative monooxygenase ydhR [Paraburkholderia sp. BL21I4N1]
MITVITSFKLSEPITREEARRLFLSKASRYRGVPGLLRKCYILSEDGSTAGGVYLWRSRAEAETMYTENWKVLAQETYGAVPSVTYFDSPVVVDNVIDEILSDE